MVNPLENYLADYKPSLPFFIIICITTLLRSCLSSSSNFTPLKSYLLGDNFSLSNALPPDFFHSNTNRVFSKPSPLLYLYSQQFLFSHVSSNLAMTCILLNLMTFFLFLSFASQQNLINWILLSFSYDTTLNLSFQSSALY